MLRSMFGMGGTEILVILIVALLFLGPDKLPEAARSISKGIRDIKKQSRVLQRTIEDDEHIGGAIRDLKSALRGEDEPVRPRPLKPANQLVEPVVSVAALAAPGTAEHGAGPDEPAADPQAVAPNILGPGSQGDTLGDHSTAASPTGPDARPALTLPPTAGEPDDGAVAAASDAADLAAMVKPAPDTIPHKSPAAADLSDTSEPKHG
jgi:sec-independent protein translocase protein TatB